MTLVSCVPSPLLFASALMVSLVIALANFTLAALLFSATPASNEQNQNAPSGPNKDPEEGPGLALGLAAWAGVADASGSLSYNLPLGGPFSKSHLDALMIWVQAPEGFNDGQLALIGGWAKTIKLPNLGDSSTVEALASSVTSILPKFIYTSSLSQSPSRSGASQKRLLAQAEAIVHKPLGFASSPSLPGTISSPWWTDFAHLIYWFYFVATFATVAFLWYLYDFRVRRVETAHPIRETRGFSRAQTGDLVTAVLPLTWSATMVMHASTHSINFDENTAGTAFSFTVVAYQWGWNYYFPRDIIAQLEAAPKVVGRGRVVSFEALPLESLQASHLDSWALRATVGSSHGSRTGRLNSSSALSLVLPTDIPAGFFTSALATSSAKGLHWRKALASALSEVNNPTYDPNWPTLTKETEVEPNFNLNTATLFRSKPSVYISGSRITMVHRHLAPQFLPSAYTSASWLTATPVSLEGSDIQTRAGRDLLSVPEAPALPALENISGGNRPDSSSAPVSPYGLNLDHLRGPLSISTQHVLWTGPDSVTGAGSTSLGSTEDHGWLSPVTARESGLRAALAARSAFLSSLGGFPTTAGEANLSLLMPFDINARLLLSHAVSPKASLPFTWTLASAALESEIDVTSLDLWANSLLPEMTQGALAKPSSLVIKQNTPSRLASLLTPATKDARPFLVAPISPNAAALFVRAATPFVTYLTTRGAPLCLPILLPSHAGLLALPSPSLAAGHFRAPVHRPSSSIEALSALFLAMLDPAAKALFEPLTRPSLVFNPLCMAPAWLVRTAEVPGLSLLNFAKGGSDASEAAHFGTFSAKKASLLPQPLCSPTKNGGSLVLTPPYTVAAMPGLGGRGRIKFSPSPLGLGLDEGRLVRTGGSRLVDTSMIGAKLEGLSTPSLILPRTPVTVLGLGWSTSASLSSYPSYKLARGGMMRRPFTGLSAQPKALEGLKEALGPLNLSKNISHTGLPILTLVKPSMPKFYTTAPSLDTQIGAWAHVWATLTPAPTEDLDPTFISAFWTPEVNTTRRSDHNSRYLVSWSPLLGSITTGAPFNPSLSGPAARSAFSPASLRSSVLALNELGLKNTFGASNARPTLLQSDTLEGKEAGLLSVAPSSALASPSAPSKWAALWGASPYPSTNPFVNSATQSTPDKLGGRSATLLTSRAGLLRSGALSPAVCNMGGGDALSPLTDALSKLEFSALGAFDLGSRPRQGYLPLNSDISASRRLRVTKGITLPSDTPMHVICGSKDVIHSWAIPGLNVKIDCIPGYNSHRRLLLRWRGAYWGQCMEVCGRYHHWMPIMVNVVHPALFADWCLTFLRGLDSQSANGPTTLPPLDLEALLKPLGR